MSRLCGCSDNGGYYFLFSSRSTRFIEPYQRLKSRYAISKPLRKGSRSPEQPINRISRDCRPLLRPDSPAYSSRQYCQWHCRGAEHRQKFPRRDSTQRLVYFFPLSIFFHFSFFFLFAFTVCRIPRGCKNHRGLRTPRSTHPLVQRYSTSRIELINRISREYWLPRIHKRDTPTHLFPLPPVHTWNRSQCVPYMVAVSFHISISICAYSSAHRLNWPFQKASESISREIALPPKEIPVSKRPSKRRRRVPSFSSYSNSLIVLFYFLNRRRNFRLWHFTRWASSASWRIWCN